MSATPAPTRVEWFALSALVAGALAARVYVSFLAGLPAFSTDTYVYLRMADGIIAGMPLAAFPNGYPVIVAMVKLVAGNGYLVSALLTLNIVLSAAGVLLVFWIARHMTSNRFALLAAAITAFMPSQLNYVRQLLTEVPATFFLLLGTALLISWRTTLAAGSGLVLFLTGAVRSTLAPLGLIDAGYLALVRQWRRAVLLLSGVIAGALLAGILHGAHLIRPAANLSSNLLIAIGSNSARGIDFSTESFSAAEKAAPLSTYLRFAANRPEEFAAQRLGSVWELWGPWPSAGDANAPRSKLSRLAIGVRFPLLLLAILAFVRRAREPAVVLCALPIALITLIHTAFFSEPRFTFPVEPLVTILAAVALRDLWCGPMSQKRHAPVML